MEALWSYAERANCTIAAVSLDFPVSMIQQWYHHGVDNMQASPELNLATSMLIIFSAYLLHIFCYFSSSGGSTSIDQPLQPFCFAVLKACCKQRWTNQSLRPHGVSVLALTPEMEIPQLETSRIISIDEPHT